MTRSLLSFRTLICVAAANVGVVVPIAIAGPLDPPGGPIASTGKTLTEVEPRIAIGPATTPGDSDSVFRITQPGSYYLTGNMSGVLGKHGIEIVSSGVTIDLMGFDVSGVSGSLDGIRTSAVGLRNLTVRNGSVRSWGGTGVNLIAVDGGRIEGISSGSCGGHGISTTDSVVINCYASSNTLNGIVATSSTISSCTANGNLQNGIAASSHSTISRCTAIRNTSHGISAGTGTTIEGCSTSDNEQVGIAAATNCTISGSTARSNAGAGISVGSGSLVTGCTSSANDLDGITLASDSLAMNNICDSNGLSTTTPGAGIRATGADNRIEANNCTDSDVGVQCDTAGNIIIRNTCSGNTTNWSLVANNVYGPIIDRTVPGSPAVNGSAAADATASTHPNANFSY